MWCKYKVSLASIARPCSLGTGPVHLLTRTFAYPPLSFRVLSTPMDNRRHSTTPVSIIVAGQCHNVLLYVVNPFTVMDCFLLWRWFALKYSYHTLGVEVDLDDVGAKDQCHCNMGLGMKMESDNKDACMQKEVVLRRLVCDHACVTAGKFEGEDGVDNSGSAQASKFFLWTFSPIQVQRKVACAPVIM